LIGPAPLRIYPVYGKSSRHQISYPAEQAAAASSPRSAFRRPIGHRIWVRSAVQTGLKRRNCKARSGLRRMRKNTPTPNRCGLNSTRREKRAGKSGAEALRPDGRRASAEGL